MILYRAMCKEERDLTIENNRLSFKKRYKWFSQDLEWIKLRVMDGCFNNSKFKPGRYKYLLKFEINNKCIVNFSKISKKEWMLHVWKSNFDVKNIEEMLP